MSGQSTHTGATGHEAHMDPVTAREAATLGIWTFLATEVLLFGGLFTAYVVFRIKYPQLFYEGHLKLDRVLGAINTLVLIADELDRRTKFQEQMIANMG